MATNKPKVIVGFSSGPDSVFLLQQLLNKKIQLPDGGIVSQPKQIILAHFNYNLRGKDSLADQKFAEKTAQQYGLTLEIQSQKVKNLKGNLEENCRNLRYQFFEKLRKKHQAKYILTGHQQNDLIETFLLNLIRGTNLKGLSPLPALDPARHLFRPLLPFQKSEVLKYLKQHKLKFRLDASNQDLKFSRNRLRLKIIPELNKINAQAVQNLANSINNLKENLQILENQISDWVNTNTNLTNFPAHPILLNLNHFLRHPPQWQKLILSEIYQQIHQKSLTSPQLKEILSTINKNRAGLKKEFGAQTTLQISRDSQGEKWLKISENIVKKANSN